MELYISVLKSADNVQITCRYREKHRRGKVTNLRQVTKGYPAKNSPTEFFPTIFFSGGFFSERTFPSVKFFPICTIWQHFLNSLFFTLSTFSAF